MGLHEHDPVIKAPRRRRSMDDNARRGGNKIGRVAGLRPGRITLTPIHLTQVGAAQTPHPPMQDHRGFASAMTLCNKDKFVEQPCWESDQHSQHSSVVHGTAKRKRQASVRKRGEHRACATEQYMNDSHTPVAKAKGWLALPHHRGLSGSGDWRGGNRMIDKAAEGLIRAQGRQLLGLLPALRSKKRDSRKKI